MRKALNIEFSLLKAFGIIAVVLSHHLNPVPSFFPANSFVMPLFFFASGYFYNPGSELKPLRYLKKRFVWFLSVFYVYHLYHALELAVLWNHGIHLGWGPPQWPQLLYYPFITFSAYGLGFPMWFVLQLFVVQIVYLLLRMVLRPLAISEQAYTLFFLILALVSTGLSVAGYTANYHVMLLLRTLFCLFFLHVGHYYRTDAEHKIPLFTSPVLLGVVLVQVACITLYNNPAYAVGYMHFHGHALLPFVVSFTGIYMGLFAARVLAPHVTERHILVRIGTNTFHIAAMHMSFCFAVKLLLRALDGATAVPITDPLYSYDVDRYWALYLAVGVLAPLCMIENLRRARGWLIGLFRGGPTGGSPTST